MHGKARPSLDSTPSDLEDLHDRIMQYADVVVDQDALVRRAAFAHHADEREIAVKSSQLLARFNM